MVRVHFSIYVLDEINILLPRKENRKEQLCIFNLLMEVGGPEKKKKKNP